jgi:ABC-2 type transport system ATP-binding protein
VAVIEVRDLRKRYGDLDAVAGVSFAIDEGEVFALLGPNGAGKSTTVEILEGHRNRTSGSVTVLGVDPGEGGRDYRDRIGIVLQSSGIERELTVREALDHYRSAYRRPRAVGEMLELVELTEQADQRVGTLSGGQQRRIDLALGLIGSPEVLFLDEPTTGFDPSARRRAWDLVARLRDTGTTILLTTHYMEEAQFLADRVAVISNGRIVAEGTPASLGGGAEGPVVSFRLPAELSVAELQSAVGEAADVRGIVDQGVPTVRVRSTSTTALLHRLTGLALERGFELEGLQVRQPSLEQIYLELVGEDGGS